MALLDLVGRRWAMRVIWELREGPLVFRELQAACDGMSASVLRDRLAELRAARLVEHDPGRGYGLTPLGKSLLAAFEPVLEWSKTWAAELDPGAAPEAGR